MPDLEMWGGLECSVARIGDRFRNQVIETGHQDRIADLDLIADLGLRTVRYPVIWETIAPDHPEVCDWRWHDERLRRLKTLGIRVIAGLLHHGSGPRYTDLLDPAFPTLLAGHARNVARRYPWIDLFTPINEPLTTARFCGLYGHWYPHARDDRSFLRALFNQCRAIAEAMNAIRRITPTAKLVQTEDVGKVFSTPRLRYQADFENARRWLSLDLLCGTLTRDHVLFPYLAAHGISVEELELHRQSPCVPDLIGMNHYLTSERFLHSRVSAFPACFAASNGRVRYADVEAVRMELPRKHLGPEARLSELWTRYKLPIAITEVHLGCTRDEQLRWLLEVWEAAVHLRRAAVDIRSVTSWSLFGAVDWNSLLTRDSGFYESGAFDVRGDRPRMTAVGEAVRCLAKQGTFSHPVAANVPGWWHRPERLYTRKDKADSRRRRKRRLSLVLVGDNRQWIRASIRSARTRGLEYAVVPGSRLKAGAEGPLLASLRRLRAWALIDVRGCAAGPLEGKDRSSLYRTCHQIGVRVAQVSDNLEYESVEAPREQPVPIRFAVSGAKSAPLSHATALIFLGSPNTVDTLIDLLIDGEQGVWTCSSNGFKTGQSETTIHSAKP